MSMIIIIYDCVAIIINNFFLTVTIIMNKNKLTNKSKKHVWTIDAGLSRVEDETDSLYGGRKFLK